MSVGALLSLGLVITVATSPGALADELDRAPAMEEVVVTARYADYARIEEILVTARRIETPTSQETGEASAPTRVEARKYARVEPADLRL